MTTTLSIIRYKKRFIPFALLAMALWRLPLWLRRGVRFYKLVGCGKNGTFDKTPDWQQWGILLVQGSGNWQGGPATNKELYGGFIAGWLRLFGCEVWTMWLQPTEGHGSWDGKQPFGKLPKQSDISGPVVILTRATIRLSKLRSFWQHVDGVAATMATAPGFISSVGIGEVPWIKQATVSIWQSREQMRQFAYKMQEHAEVVRKTRQEKWYSEDMFVRFTPLYSTGSINNQKPLEGIL